MYDQNLAPKTTTPYGCLKSRSWVVAPTMYDQNLAQKKTMTYGIENQCPALGQAQNCGGAKGVNGVPTPPLHLVAYYMPTT